MSIKKDEAEQPDNSDSASLHIISDPEQFPMLRHILQELELPEHIVSETGNIQASCPNPDHPDERPSFTLYPDCHGYCHSRCGRMSAQQIAKHFGTTLPENPQGCTVKQLAAAKGFIGREIKLNTFGVSDAFKTVGKDKRPCVEIAYYDENFEVKAVKRRLNRHRTDGQQHDWKKHGSIPYGVFRLRDFTEGYVLIVEGETDCWTGWIYDKPVIGIPGAKAWKSEWVKYFSSFKDVYVWQEPDDGGRNFVESIARDIPDLKVINGSDEAKDLNELYLRYPESFYDEFEYYLKSAQPFSEILSEEDAVKAKEYLSASEGLLKDPNLIDLLSAVIKLSYVGDVRPALICVMILISRLFPRPICGAMVGPSAVGKNAAVDAALPFFPESAYYSVSAGTPTILLYNDEPFKNRTIIYREVDSLPDDGPAASALRNMLSDGYLHYEYTVQDKETKRYTTESIVKEGPTGFMTTSIRSLKQQMGTRVLEVLILDDPDSTKKILRIHNQKANDEIEKHDYDQWIKAMLWLELAGNRKVYIPFADQIVELIDTKVSRLRRDYPQLVTLIQVSAFLHQLQRETGSDGRIIASYDDYKFASWLLADVFQQIVSQGATSAVTEIVQAVERVMDVKGKEYLVKRNDLEEELGMSKHTVLYRLRKAIEGGYLVNEGKARGEYLIKLGDPLPDTTASTLPTVQELKDALAVKEQEFNPKASLHRDLEDGVKRSNEEWGKALLDKAKERDWLYMDIPEYGFVKGQVAWEEIIEDLVERKEVNLLGEIDKQFEEYGLGL